MAVKKKTESHKRFTKHLNELAKRRKDNPVPAKPEKREEKSEEEKDSWGYKETKLGKHLLARLKKHKPKGLFEALTDCTQEQFNYLADFSRSLVKLLDLRETVTKPKNKPDDTKFVYSFKGEELCVVAMSDKRPCVFFPCMYFYTKDFPVKRFADNPLLPFLCGFFQIDTHIYGPAQGLYQVYFALLRGYLICHYPETHSKFFKE